MNQTRNEQMNQDSEYNSGKKADPDTAPTQFPKQWRRVVMTFALLLLGVTGGSLLYGWYFVQQKLIPLIEKEAGNYLHRPLELGELKSLSLTEANFGKSALPATGNNPDFVKVQRVKINLAPIYFLRRRELKLDLILLKPDVYIEQDAAKQWTPTDFGSGKKSTGKIKVKVKSIQFEGGQLALVAYNSQSKSLNPAVIAKIDQIAIYPQDQAIKFDAAAQLIQGGKFSLEGIGYNQSGTIALEILGDQLKAEEVSNLLALPLSIKQGSLDGQLGVTLKKDQPIPELQGALDLDQVSLQIPGLVKPFSNSRGKLRFQGLKINLSKISTNFGEVSGVASGALNLAAAGNYQINTEVNPVVATKVIDALELAAPVPIKGKIRGNVGVTGSLAAPVVKFAIKTAGASQIDKLDFQKIDADLELIGSTLTVRQFTSLPKGGGTIVGNGKLQLDGEQNMAFNVQAENVDPQAIAKDIISSYP
ncbi:MAG: hypothetical protein HC930_17380 [Hydrococcus sp. SU_1_0]|nr:hypothetical protein [Hydrococcus sp. SU_1_0]